MSDVTTPAPEVISIVIPVCNEAESLPILFGEISETAKVHDLHLDVVFVDDGSTDGSWKVIDDLARRDARARGIRFRRNFGKAAALSAGFRAAKGSLVLTMDADLQDDPKEIPRFLEAIHAGLDVVSGWKKVRLDPWHKVYPSRVFNALVSRTTGVHLHDHNCGMKCYRREVFREVKIYGELHRLIPVLAASRGFKVGELVINHRERKFGRSKYGVRRFVKGFLDLMTVKFLTSFSHRPQHVLGTCGLLSFFLGALGMTFLAVTWVIRAVNPESGFQPLHERALLFYSMGAMLLGAQLLSMGFLAELMIANRDLHETTYSIAEQTAPPEPPRREPRGNGEPG